MKRFALVLLVLAGCAPEKRPDLRSRDPYEVALAVLDLPVSPVTDEERRQLGKLLDHEAPLVRDAAMIVIGDLGLTEHAERIGAMLMYGAGPAEANEEVRIRACITLGDLKEPSSIGALSRAIRLDPSARVRTRAAYALGVFGPVYGALVPLADVIGDADAAVRHVSREILVRMTERSDIGMDAAKWKQAIEEFTRNHP